MITTVGGGLTAIVDAGRGAKIVSLRDDSGREWLAQDDPQRAVGEAFIDAEMAGWDECAPTIVECEIDGARAPDHGDLWNLPFDLDGSTVHAIGPSLDYDFARTIEPTIDGLRLRYRADARSRPFPFLCAAHPQFVAPPGTRVELPESVTEVVDVFLPDWPRAPWRDDVAAISELKPGTSRKLYVAPETPVSAAALVHPDGRRLELTWSSEAPYLGLWIDNGEYGREPVIAIEPATGYFDSTATAVQLGRVPMLEPGHPLTWWVEIRATGANVTA